MSELWPLALAALALFLVGGIAWLGLNRSMVLRAWPSPTVHLSVFYIGLAGLLAVGASLLPSWLGPIVLLVSAVSFGIGAMAILWLPRWLKPAWLRDAAPWQEPR